MLPQSNTSGSHHHHLAPGTGTIASDMVPQSPPIIGIHDGDFLLRTKVFQKTDPFILASQMKSAKSKTAMIHKTRSIETSPLKQRPK
jgi:hypothetical protein